MAERQSARMSKITNDGLIRSGAGCFVAVPRMATVGDKGFNYVSCTKHQQQTALSTGL